MSALLRVVGKDAARAGVRLPFAGRDEPQEQPPRRVLLRRVQPLVGVLRRLFDRARNAADLGVGFGGEPIALALSPKSP